jgi:hypothetical protein
MPTDLRIVDNYLARWDRFAQGDNELVPHLRDNKEAFEAALTRLLEADDERAPARMVFYAVVQVGGFIPLGSDLGRAARKLLGPKFPVFKSEDGTRALFAGDLYFWWGKISSEYKPYSLLDEWSQRDFAETVVIPMYESSCKRK